MAKKHSEVFNWLKIIDLYIQPSDTEGLPQSVIETMSVGCPVIGSNAGGIPELIDSSLIFKKGDVGAITDLLDDLNKNQLALAANNNLKKSCDYLKPKLYNRRKNFFNMVIKNEVDERV